jgi:hypothetical protein
VSHDVLHNARSLVAALETADPPVHRPTSRPIYWLIHCFREKTG